MSLAIKVEKIVDVLMSDGWHRVEPGTFTIDSYEFFEDEVVAHAGGRSGVCATGFQFRLHTGEWLSAPLTSIVAVKESP